MRDIPRTLFASADLIGRGSMELIWAYRTSGWSGLDPALARWGRRVIRDLGIDLHAEGIEHVDPGEPYVVVALHEGFADVAVLTQLPLRMVFTARSELLEWALLGRFLDATGQLIVSDDSAVSAMRTLLREGSEHLKGGRSVVVFPQGSILGVETAFQDGAAGLAKAAGVRILPVVVAGTHRVWEHPFSPTVRFGQPVFVSVLPPVDSDQWVGLERRMKTIAAANGHAPVRHFDPERDGWWDGYRFGIDPAFVDLARRHRERLARNRPTPA